MKFLPADPTVLILLSLYLTYPARRHATSGCPCAGPCAPSLHKWRAKNWMSATPSGTIPRCSPAPREESDERYPSSTNPVGAGGVALIRLCGNSRFKVGAGGVALSHDSGSGD